MQHEATGKQSLRRHALIAGIAWTCVVLGSLAWNLRQDERQTMSLARKEAVANFNKDQALRLWATAHGGVYVPASDTTPPSPYLAHVPERDVTTPSGKQLTLLNPNYMVRELQEYYQEKYGIRGHITGLVLLRPENSPDEWEARALSAFLRGENEVSEVTALDGRPFLRLMRPMIMEEGCLPCHGHLGFEVGQVRGGVGVAVPLSPYLEAGRERALALYGGHGAIWLLGVGLIGLGAGQINRRLAETLAAQKELRQLNHELEERVTRRAAALADEQKRLSVIVSTAPYGIVTSDETGVIESANAAAAAIFGYDHPEEMAGLPLTTLVPPPHAERHADYVADYLAGKPSQIIGVGREAPGLRRDGVVVPLYIAIGVARLENRLLFTAVVRDRTAEKRAQAEVLAAKEQADAARRQAETANMAKSQFIASMSHELRTPINAVLGFAQLMEQGVAGPLNDKQADYVRIMLTAGNHLHQLIIDILDFSKIDAGKLSLSLEAVSLREVMEETQNLLAPLAERFHVMVEDHISADCPDVRADYVRVKQVLVNLCANAVKYAGKGSRVNVSAMIQSDGMVRLTVADNGRGIPPEKIGDIFQPFCRAGAEAGDIEGAGLGLTITRRLVEMMNGRISVYSRPGDGATFTVELPAATASERRPVDAAAPAAVGRLGEGRWTILYVEDNPLNVELMREMLAPYPNIRFQVAGSGEAGLAMALAEPPDLVLMDINLPGIDGFTALERLQADPRTAHVPVVALSATAMPEDVRRGVRAGFVCYLVKPLDVARTLEAVNLALARREG